MAKKTIFDHHPVNVVRELFIGDQEEWVGGVQLDFLDAVLTSGTSDDVKWTILDLHALVVAAGETIPRDALAAILDVAVNDSGSAGQECYMALSAPGALGTQTPGRAQYVYCGDVNDRVGSRLVIVELSDDGNIAWTIVATGAVFDYTIKLVGWLIAGSDRSRISLPSANLFAKFVVNQ